MAPVNKSKAAGVSASSFIDLKSELVKKESEFAKRKATGKTYDVGGSRGSLEGNLGKKGKGTVWARTNKGVAARRARDMEALKADKATAETAHAALERKAKLYDKLKKGKSGGLSDAQFDALLVDFDQKGMEDGFESGSDDADESLTVPKPPDSEDDPLVEYEDEFGRMRTARRSEVPRNLMASEGLEEEDVDPFVIHNPVNHFPVFEPTAERVAAIEAAAVPESETTHYDAKKEVRAKGAAFYAFSKDEEQRRSEMEDLKAAREETARVRRETGALDLKAGEIDGMVAPEGGSLAGEGASMSRSRAAEKRKREIEERRKLVEAKRRKMKGDRQEEERITNGSTMAADLEQKSSLPMAASDPFAALEAKTQHSSKTSVADDFLVQLH